MSTVTKNDRLVTLKESDALQASTTGITPEQMTLIKDTVAQGATDAELQLFIHDCRRQGVHPLDRLIHFSKRGGRYTPITSIDFMRMRAADTGEMAGNDDPAFTFTEGEAVLPKSASVTVHRLDKTGVPRPYTATARWAEYLPPKGQDFMWLKMPQLMLGKCAEALALRKAFPKQLHGIYERAEMAQAGREDEPKPTRPTEIKPDSSHDGRQEPAVTREQPDEASTLLLLPEEDRVYLEKEIMRLAPLVPDKDRDDAKVTYGVGKTLKGTDVSALSEYYHWLQARTKQ